MKKLVRVRFILFFAVILTVLAGCGGNRNEPISNEEYLYEQEEADTPDIYEPDIYEPDIHVPTTYEEPHSNNTALNIDFNDVIIAPSTGILTGRTYAAFPYHTTFNDTEHFFADMAEHEKINRLRYVEIITTLAYKELGLLRPERVFHRHEPGMYFVERGRRVSICGDSIGTGELLFSLSGQRLPAWLSAGLELYWIEKHGPSGICDDFNAPAWYAQALYRGLPSIGDEWFIPGFNMYDLDIKTATYAFARFICESGALADLADLYIYPDLEWEAEYKRAGLWASFTGSETTVREFIYRHHFRAYYQLPRHGSVNIGVSTRGQHGWHLFTPSGWSFETLEYYTSVSEEAIAFVADWLGFDLTARPIVSLFSVHPYNFNMGEDVGGGWYVQPRYAVVFTHTVYDPPWVYAHEMAHLILDRHPGIRRSNFGQLPWFPGADTFEEGLSDVLEYLFIAETNNERYGLEMSQRPLEQLRESGYLTDENIDRRATADELIAYVHIRALWHIDNFDMDEHLQQQRQWWPDIQLSPENIDWRVALHPWSSAPSFMFFLLERSTRDDFFRAYMNTDLMEEIYGYDLENLVGLWVEYLSERFYGFRFSPQY